jgi:hypothetical protein
MAIIPQMKFFSWEEVQPLGDLGCLPWAIDTLPDEPLMRILERARRRGRNDNPVRALGNCVLAGVVFQHPTIESLRRELNRNGAWRRPRGPIRAFCIRFANTKTHST